MPGTKKYAGRGTRKATPRKGTQAGRPRKPLAERRVRADGTIILRIPVATAALLQRVSTARQLEGEPDTSPEDTLHRLLVQQPPGDQVDLAEYQNMQQMHEIAGQRWRAIQEKIHSQRGKIETARKETTDGKGGRLGMHIRTLLALIDEIEQQVS